MSALDMAMDYRDLEFLGLVEPVTWGSPEPTADPESDSAHPTADPIRQRGVHHRASLPAQTTRDALETAPDEANTAPDGRRQPTKRVHAKNDGKGALPFAKVSTRIVRDAAVSPNARLLYVLLATYADIEHRTCFPSKRLLAGDLGCTTRSIQNWTTELVHAGYIEVAPRERKGGGQSSNLYLLADHHDVHPRSS
ncbi:MAG: helix-turn-helix domain-containing protein [Jatrophihabitans sp.]|uniref:helix-turn-helix domain-containing protein n=1 Tax=Jatrophihabitans sp. TaxID=1932789 RepID=UPI003F81088A